MNHYTKQDLKDVRNTKMGVHHLGSRRREKMTDGDSHGHLSLGKAVLTKCWFIPRVLERHFFSDKKGFRHSLLDLCVAHRTTWYTSQSVHLLPTSIARYTSRFHVPALPLRCLSESGGSENSKTPFLGGAQAFSLQMVLNMV